MHNDSHLVATIQAPTVPKSQMASFATFSNLEMQHSPILFCNIRYFYFTTNKSISLTNLFKIGIAFLCLIVLIFLTSFLKDEKIRKEKQEYQVEQNQEKEYDSPHLVAKQQSEDILECILNEDVEGLKSLFCPKFQNTHNLDDEIEELFRFISGEIISYDTPKSGIVSGESKSGSGCVRLNYGVIF